MANKKSVKKKGVSPRILALRANGRKGGRVRAEKYDTEQHKEWGSNAGKSTLARYGKDFFKHIRSMRKKYPKRLKRRLKDDKKDMR